MNSFITLFAVLFVATSAHLLKPVKYQPAPYIFEDVINQTLQDIISQLPDPLEVADLTVELPADGVLTGNLAVSNLVATGLQGIQIRELSLSLLGLKLTFTAAVPTLTLTTGYDGDVTVNVDPPTQVFGTGSLDVALTELVVLGSAKISLSSPITVSDVEVRLALDDAEVTITGLFNDEELSAQISQILSDDTANFLNDNQETISQILSPILEQIINDILAGVTRKVLH